MKSLAPTQKMVIFLALAIVAFGNTAQSKILAATPGPQDAAKKVEQEPETLSPKQIYSADGQEHRLDSSKRL